MNWEIAKGNWKQFSGALKQKWSKLTDNDLENVKGKAEELTGIIQERYGIGKDKAEKEINELYKNLKLH